MNKSEIQREHFNKIASVYLRSRSSESHLAYKKVWWSKITDTLRSSHILPQSGFNSLEAMCGMAEGSRFLQEVYPLGNYDGFDYSDEMVTSSKTENEGRKIQIFQSDILAFQNSKMYDLAIILGGLHHVPDSVDLALKNLNRALKMGALFINLEPTHNNFLFKFIRSKVYKRNSIFEENSERGFELTDYNSVLKNAGFEILNQFYPGLLGYVLYYNPDAFPWLNLGTKEFAMKMSRLDWFLGKTFIGKYFSFATWTIARKIRDI